MVTCSGRLWTAKVDNAAVYTGTDMIRAIQSAVDNLSAGRSSKETIHIRNSGSTGSHNWDGDVKAIHLSDNTVLDFHDHTMDVNDTGKDLIMPVLARNVNGIEVRNVRITGNPRYGIWIQSCTDIILSNITVDIPEATTVGLGIRVDDGRGAYSEDLVMDNIRVFNTAHHGVEAQAVDDFTIGTLEAENTGGGLLLNDSRNGSVDAVIGHYNNQGSGYAAFRVANTTSQCIFLEDTTHTHVFSGRVSNGHPNCQKVRTSNCSITVTGCP